MSRRISAGLSERKTEAWALAMGVRVPLADPGDARVRVHRGLLPDVAVGPPPQRRASRGFEGIRRLIAGWFGRPSLAEPAASPVAVLPTARAAPETGASADTQDATPGAAHKERGLAA